MINKKKTQKTISDKNYLSSMEEKTTNKKNLKGGTQSSRGFFFRFHTIIFTTVFKMYSHAFTKYCYY